MEVITMQSEAYKELIDKINTIEKYVVESQNEPVNTDDMWVDSHEVCRFLKISTRTLQRLRTNRIITYSVLAGKTYYPKIPIFITMIYSSFLFVQSSPLKV